ncbi:flagellar basal body P-ring formation chaperone FlgA [Ahrensia sp. R2A130]|uniref:flagellar basal body P-ring formation chaperone FlgA n=1 Tax=Ahrensia sp. R2A130 TaxID=744979 RepID=UPI0018DD8AB9|nr:flagellar basal body P-ring formation chaperone FlgA [Ahrensia sp. R2A130]
MAQDQVLVPVRTIYPGETITASDLRLVEVAAGRERRQGVLRNWEDGIGRVATATLLARRYIVTRTLVVPHAVKVGEVVRVTFRRAGLTIETKGQALQSGAVGKAIAVRSRGNAKVYQAVITAPGMVELGS